MSSRILPAEFAHWLRRHARLAVSFLGLEAAQEFHLGELAALIAPYAVHILASGANKRGRLRVAASNGQHQLRSLVMP
jgi:hypothetical protein